MSTDTNPTELPAGSDKYVGKWSTCFATDTGFEQDKFSLTKVNDTKGAIFDGKSAYKCAGCTGTQTVLKAKGGAALEKYLGTWRSACIASDGGSRREILTLTKISDSSAELTWEWPACSSRNCSGTAVGLVDQAGFLLQGTRTVGADTVDKVV